MEIPNKILLSAIAILYLAAFAYAIDLPALKEGLWSIHTQTSDNLENGKKEGTQKICRDHAYDAQMREKAKNVPGCKVLNENFSGHTYTLEMECNRSGSVIKSKAVTTIESDGSVRSEMHGTYSPPFRGLSEMTTIMEQKYEGSCPSGTGPGDIIRPDGTVLHPGKQ